MRIVVTGTARGIGEAIAQKLLNQGHEIFGIDVLPESTVLKDHPNYHHHLADVSAFDELPDIPMVEALVNNAGVVYPGRDLRNLYTNLLGAMNCTEKYALQSNIRAVVNMVSVSAHNGAEYPYYGASKGGLLTYTKWTAQEIAKYGAVCNSVSPGGVYTDMNLNIMNDAAKLQAVYDETLLGKWAYPEEVADLVYYLLCINKSVTAQDLIIDNGEMAKFNFIC